MGYYLQALICRTADTKLITKRYSLAKTVIIGQGLSLIPMTEGLFDQINDYSTAADTGAFVYLNEHMESALLKAMADASLAYVEAEYFGGQGGQTAVIWDKSERVKLLNFGAGSINAVLQWFGVLAEKKKDEFLTLHLDRHRNTGDWLEDGL